MNAKYRASAIALLVGAANVVAITTAGTALGREWADTRAVRKLVQELQLPADVLGVSYGLRQR